MRHICLEHIGGILRVIAFTLFCFSNAPQSLRRTTNARIHKVGEELDGIEPCCDFRNTGWIPWLKGIFLKKYLASISIHYDRTLCIYRTRKRLCVQKTGRKMARTSKKKHETNKKSHFEPHIPRLLSLIFTIRNSLSTRENEVKRRNV